MKYPTFILPPKFFEDINDPRFDPIRHKPWFGSLTGREEIRRTVERVNALRHGTNMPVSVACKALGIDQNYVSNHKLWLDKDPFHKWKDGWEKYQGCLDDSYWNYCDNRADFKFQTIIKKLVPYYKISEGAMLRMWEYDATFYPTGYEHGIKTHA